MYPSSPRYLSILAAAAVLLAFAATAPAQVEVACVDDPETQCCTDEAGENLTPIDDGNACTTDTCNEDGTVSHADDTPGDECCNTTTGERLPRADSDVCTIDSCDENGDPAHDLQRSVIATGAGQIEAGSAGATITAKICGGTAPFTVERSVTEGPADADFAGTDEPSDVTDLTFTYAPPAKTPDDLLNTPLSGAARLQIKVTDAEGLESFDQVAMTVCMAGSGTLCADFIPNTALEGVVEFRNQDLEDEDPGTTGSRLFTPNLAVAFILSQLDIDGDGLPDNAPDTDGDGLPDNWETGGFEAQTASGQNDFDRIVFYPAPTAIVPGTPPTPIFTRLAVATSALSPDSDGDGLSDFVEVFGLMFIDENRNGILDANEWADQNEAEDAQGNRIASPDGLPSPGEFPWNNSGQRSETFSFKDEEGNADPDTALRHDFDGFVFTDPTNDDTDGDGVVDGNDNDPLINPRAFGITANLLVRFNNAGNDDIDQDGLGNGMDMGNDLTSDDTDPGSSTTILDFEVIDNPQNIEELLNFFRRDLQEAGVIPESAVEDLLGADWDGNGLWRTTDVRTWSIVIADDSSAELEDLTTPPQRFFKIGDQELYVRQTFDDLAAIVNDPNSNGYGGLATQPGDDRIGLGWQDVLQPPPGVTTNFIPDEKVWTILYSWRVPGFDIDGDGFVGVPNLSSTASVDVTQAGEELENERLTAALEGPINTNRFDLSSTVPLDASLRRANTTLQFEPFDDRIAIGQPLGSEVETDLDGQITPPPGFGSLFCGALGFLPMALMLAGLVRFRAHRRRFPRA